MAIPWPLYAMLAGPTLNPVWASLYSLGVLLSFLGLAVPPIASRWRHAPMPPLTNVGGELETSRDDRCL